MNQLNDFNYFQEEMEREFENFDDEEELVNVDGTKVKLSGKVLKVKSFDHFFQTSLQIRTLQFTIPSNH